MSLTPCITLLPEKLTGSQFPTFYGTQKVHKRVYRSPPPVPILSQINPVHAPLLHYLKIHFNNILPSIPGSYKWSLSSGLPTKTLYAPSSYVPNEVKH